jgi:hypothetical protein
MARNIYTESFMKKSIIIALLSVYTLFPSDSPTPDQNNSWKSYLTNPYVVALIMQIALKPLFAGIESVQIYLYEEYWLTEEQRKERREEKKIMLEHTKQQMLLMNDPRWRESTLQLQQQEVTRGEQNLRIGKHQLQQNEIILRRAQREEDEKDAQTLQNLIKNSSSENQAELQKKYDYFVNTCIMKRIKTT